MTYVTEQAAYHAWYWLKPGKVGEHAQVHLLDLPYRR